MKRLKCGRIHGRRAMEIVCCGLRQRFGVEATSWIAETEDTEYVYLINVDSPTFSRETISRILAYVTGTRDALMATGLTKWRPCEPSEWGAVVKDI